MMLRFYARDDQLVPLPGQAPVPGQPLHFVGRRYDAATRAHPADSTPTEVDSESSAGMRLAELTRRDACLWPADAETAAACGVPFVKVFIRDGVAQAFTPKGEA
jgi:hypothetical protein